MSCHPVFLDPTRSNIIPTFQILLQGVNAQTEALKYARTHFAKFVNIFQKDIQILMGALMYLPVGIENSPYRTLIAPEIWNEVSVRLFIYFHFAYLFNENERLQIHS